MTDNAKKSKLLELGMPLPLICGILASFGDDAVNTVIMPIMASVAQAFPEIPYATVTWLYSMPKIIIIPFALLSGYLAGRKVKFKTMALLGLGIISIAGIAPAFLNEFWEILASRMVLAVGLGLQAPIGPALVMRFFADPAKRSTMLGLGNGVLNGASIVTGMLVGNLCLINWHVSFLAYGLMAILFVATLVCLKEPPAVSVQGEASLGRSARKTGVPPIVLLLCGFFALVDCVWMPISMDLSSVLVANGWGDSATTGYLISLISLAGFLVSMVFGIYCHWLRYFNIAGSLALMALASALICFADDVAMIGVGLFLGGAAFALIICGIQNEIGALCQPAQMAFATGLFMVFEHLGGFLSSWWLALVLGIFGQEAYLAPAGVGVVFFALSAVALGFYGAWRKRTARVRSS